MSGYPSLEAFCALPVDTRGWKYTSDGYGRLLIHFPDPRQALGAFRLKATDGSTTISLRFRAIFMIEGDKGVATSNAVSYPEFAPENPRDCQFLKAVQITLGESVRDRYEISYAGTLSYFKQPIQTPLDPVMSGQWLGHQGTGPDRVWLSNIRMTIGRRSTSDKPTDVPAIEQPTPSTPPAVPQLE